MFWNLYTETYQLMNEYGKSFLACVNRHGNWHFETAVTDKMEVNWKCGFG